MNNGTKVKGGTHRFPLIPIERIAHSEALSKKEKEERVQ